MDVKHTSTLYKQDNDADMFTHITRERFSEKQKVAFTNCTVFILHFYIYELACLVSCFGLECQDLNKAHNYSQLPGSLSPDYNLYARQIPHQLRFPSQTIPDCIRYIIDILCYNFKSQTNILALY